MKSEKRNISYISFASVISAIAVVFLHANGCFWAFSTTERYWKTANIIECVFFFAVPVFFMISGATLLDYNKRYSMKCYFLKRFQKTLFPYVFWSLFAVAFQVYILKSMNLADVNVTYIVNGLLAGNLLDIYWFFMPLFCLYLSIPLFAAVPEEHRKKIFSYVVIVAFILNSGVPFVINVFHLPINFPISIEVGAGYLIYLLLGYLISHYDISRRNRFLLYVAGIVGLLLHMIGTYRLSMLHGEIDGTFKGYLNVPCILYSVGLFVFFRYAGENLMEKKIIGKIINVLKSYTFSLYLLHWYILQIILRITHVSPASIVYRLSAPFITFAIVVVVTWIMRKIPILRKLLP